MGDCTAMEYDRLTRRIAELEEVYELTTCELDRDIRDDLLSMRQRQAEIQLETVFALRRQLSGAGNWRIQLTRTIDLLEKKIKMIEERLFDSLERLLDKLGKKLLEEMRRERHGKK